jgi:ABC-2 type transport system ATP-binding protein
MSVSVQLLSKYFGMQKAVDALSFDVKRGEVLGFLGPNGAGKSTTMRILTGYLRADEGSVTVNGFDVEKEPVGLKRSVGYLPEHNPLYGDLYIREYLHMICQLQGVGNIRQRVGEVVEITGLAPEIGKKIGALSKGFRQRVGLAQALVHDPDVLILDEPTSGLDPNQLAEIRSLIRKLGETKTVIFSTHIMQEVQAICSRVLIINRGKMVFDEPIGFLAAQRVRGQTLVVQFDRKILSNSLLKQPGIAHVEEASEGYYVAGEEGTDIRPVVFRFAVDSAAVILEMYEKKDTVEDVFHVLTSARS